MKLLMKKAKAGGRRDEQVLIDLLEDALERKLVPKVV